jgi:hypothetical protein
MDKLEIQTVINLFGEVISLNCLLSFNDDLVETNNLLFVLPDPNKRKWDKQQSKEEPTHT